MVSMIKLGRTPSAESVVLPMSSGYLRMSKNTLFSCFGRGPHDNHVGMSGACPLVAQG